MKLVVLVLCLFALSAYAQFHAGDFVTAYPEHFSWEMIFSNNTSYLDEVDAHRGVIYVAGEGYVREVLEEPFELSVRHEYFHQSWHRFLDFKVFQHNNVSYVFGPVTTSYEGISHSLRIATISDSDHFYLPGNVQIAAVAATDMHEHVVVYGAGWQITDTNGVLTANFSVFRLFMHPNHTANHNSSFITFNETNDVVVLSEHRTGYTEYDREFKPYIFHDYMKELLIVVDPASSRVYKFHAPNHRNESFTYMGSSFEPFSGSNITSAVYDYERHNLVIGTRGRGSFPGTIVSLSINDPSEPIRVNFVKTLSHWESNPKGLALRHDGLFVALNGGSYLLHLNLTLNGELISYSTLPWYMRDVSNIHASRHHLYVVTNEQHSKIARTAFEHFCASPCDSINGYCGNGTCACHAGHVLNNTRALGHCSPHFVTDETTIVNEKKISYHAGEITMGLLFAVCFIAAAVGWFVVWRNYQGKPVFGAKSKYSSLSREERDNFLGDD